MFVLLVITITSITQDMKAQDVAVKSNVLADALLNPNLGIEVGLAPKWTLEVSSTHGCSLTTGTGSTGLFNLKSDTGSAIDSPATLWVLIFMVGSITSEVLTEESASLVRMPVSWKIPVIRVGLSVEVLLMVMHGY